MNYEDYLKERETQKSDFLANLPELKAEIKTRLNILKIPELEVHFDGQGDNGGIEEMTPEIDDEGHEEFFEDLTYKILEIFHIGWENNEGALGSITFTPTTIDYDFNIRVEETQYDGQQF